MNKHESTYDTLSKGCLLKGKSYDYYIEGVLGQGSFGITYLASVRMSGELGSLNTGMRVAIKEFFMRDINGRDGTSVTSGSKHGIYEDYKRKFKREALNLSKLNHPDIVKVVELFEANSTAYYVMEYIDGGSLNSYIDEHGSLNENTAVALCTKIGSALAFMHSKRMLHLDLKPSNIMMRRDGTPVLIDFGLSKQYDNNGEPESSTNVGLGTPGYAPIEQADYHDGKGFPVTMDVYALGATMFKMLTGQRPPEASSILNDGFPYGLLKKHGVSTNVIKAVESAMNPVRGKRCASVKDFLYLLCSEVTFVNIENEESTDVDDKKINTKNVNQQSISPVSQSTGTILRGILVGLVELCVAIVELCIFMDDRNSYYSPYNIISICLDINSPFYHDNSGRGLLAMSQIILWLALGVYVLYILKKKRNKINALIWNFLKWTFTVACFIFSLGITSTHPYFTLSVFLLSCVLSVISGYMFSVRKKRCV